MAKGNPRRRRDPKQRKFFADLPTTKLEEVIDAQFGYLKRWFRLSCVRKYHGDLDPRDLSDREKISRVGFFRLIERGLREVESNLRMYVIEESRNEPDKSDSLVSKAGKREPVEPRPDKGEASALTAVEDTADEASSPEPDTADQSAPEPTLPRIPTSEEEESEEGDEFGFGNLFK